MPSPADLEQDFFFSSLKFDLSFQVTTVAALSCMASHHVHRQFMGVVVSAGKMMKTVKVRIADREWNKRIKKVILIGYAETWSLLTIL